MPLPITSLITGEVFEAWEVHKLLWPPCSPDLNAIEHVWAWVRRQVGGTGKFLLESPSLVPTKWRITGLFLLESPNQTREEWANLAVEVINTWIDALPRRIQQVVDCEGGNEFHGW